jgi:hypothetical protein
VGQTLRGEGLVKKIIEGRVQGKKQRGRQRRKMLDDVRDGASYRELKEMAINRGFLWCRNLPKDRALMNEF